MGVDPARSGLESPLRPIARERVWQAIAEYIKEQILDGKIGIGERVPQDEVARVLGVSNTPVREAIIALEHEGVVDTKDRRGAYVNDFDRGSITNSYELWGLLYGWALRRAVACGSAAAKQHLVTIAEDVQAVERAEDMHRRMLGFADGLANVCGSPAWRHLLDAIPRLVGGNAFYACVPELRTSVPIRMGKVAEAIACDDGETAAIAAEDMLREHGRTLIRELERRGLFQTVPRSRGHL
jgi:DNA-binding GntR family transcriptional regulator